MQTYRYAIVNGAPRKETTTWTTSDNGIEVPELGPGKWIKTVVARQLPEGSTLITESLYNSMVEAAANQARAYAAERNALARESAQRAAAATALYADWLVEQGAPADYIAILRGEQPATGASDDDNNRRDRR